MGRGRDLRPRHHHLQGQGHVQGQDLGHRQDQGQGQDLGHHQGQGQGLHRQTEHQERMRKIV